MQKISVIIPVYNVEMYIEDCLRSVLDQTYQNLEIIIVNDGSTDNSMTIVENLKDDRCKIVNKKNGGLSSARNEGIRIATGDYISFIDSDDMLESINAFKELMDIAFWDKPDVIIGNASYLYDDSKVVQPLMLNINVLKGNSTGIECLYKLYKNNIYNAAACFKVYCRKLLIENSIYFKEGVYHEDELFTPRVLIKANRVSIYPKSFYIYRQRSGSITSNNNPKRAYDIFEIAEELNRIYSKLDHTELKDLLYDSLSYMCLRYSYIYKLKIVPRTIEEIIINKPTKLKTKIKGRIFIFNKNFYYLLEQILYKIKSFV